MYPSVNHFIVRPGTDDGTPGPIVPLVAVDQLPDWMQLTGVPRELDAEQTIGLTNLGLVDKDDSIFEVRLHHGKIRAILNSADEKTDSHSSGGGKGKAKANKKKKTAPHAETKSKSIEKMASEESLPTFTELAPVEKPPPQAQPAERMLSASRHNTANTAVGTQARHNSSEKPLRPHMTEATRDEPQQPAAPKHMTTEQDEQPTICRHWCHHGSCKWGLKCRHQHRMPMTVDGLKKVGLKDFPTWYLLMMSGAGGLPGLLSMDATLSGHGEGQPCPARQHAAGQKQPPSQPINQHHVPDHPSSLDLRLVRGRMSALLTSGGAVSNRQLKQLREMRHLLLRGAGAPATGAQGGQQQQQQPRPHNNNNGNYANLYTNASVAANAASIRRQAERQQQVRDDMPVVTRVRAREDVEDHRGQAIVAGRAGGSEENLLDID
ncbi:hypothetical protein INS49_010278 [Diaporthe citri]|uniref:uncharacterized protein n=1 Tax=Diaporthe citri TaxID=83186 RepID=UPI001C8028D8|nr:uncharacterized protein INS49_010278 [Diaporthe citri]KAG6362049.1 hypothetical protein INS49_010278 [Diaporthe citri]